jgi:hypothetical protein
MEKKGPFSAQLFYFIYKYGFLMSAKILPGSGVECNKYWIDQTKHPCSVPGHGSGHAGN